MNIPKGIEKTLKGGWRGLYGEVVECDCYRLRSLSFQPDIIYDIGANVGTFSLFARSLFPAARIISVEPDPDNCAAFRQYVTDEGTKLYEMALGCGQIYHGLTARNGSGETYLSEGLGYPRDLMEEAVRQKRGLEYAHVDTFLLPELRFYTPPTYQTRMIKIDCEGAENSIWKDPESMAFLRSMDYIALEVHFYAQTGQHLAEVRAETLRALKTLEETHNCELSGVHFWATKKT